MSCAGVSPLPAVGIPAREGLLPGVCATRPGTAALCPAAGLLLRVPAYLWWRPVCLTPNTRKQFAARCDGWWVPLKWQETDVQALGFGQRVGLHRPALGEGAGEHFAASGRTTSARDETTLWEPRLHLRSLSS